MYGHISLQEKVSQFRSSRQFHSGPPCQSKLRFHPLKSRRSPKFRRLDLPGKRTAEYNI